MLELRQRRGACLYGGGLAENNIAAERRQELGDGGGRTPQQEGVHAAVELFGALCTQGHLLCAGIAVTRAANGVGKHRLESGHGPQRVWHDKGHQCCKADMKALQSSDQGKKLWAIKLPSSTLSACSFSSAPG